MEFEDWWLQEGVSKPYEVHHEIYLQKHPDTHGGQVDSLGTASQSMPTPGVSLSVVGNEGISS